MSMGWDLVADIGGTTMRVAQVADGNILARKDFRMAPDRTVPGNLAEVVADLEGTPNCVVCAGAGPKQNGEIRLTNGGWLISEPEIQAATGATRALVINDFEAAAWSLATVTDADVAAIGTSSALRDGHRVAIGPGTGLGVGSLIWDGARYRVMPGEGGHVSVGPLRAEDVEIFERFGNLWPETRLGDRITYEAEAMLSGTGLPFLYQAVGGAQGTPAADVFARAKKGEPEAVRSIDIFREQLAAIAGDLSVTLTARGGIFLVGGVAQSNPHIFDQTFWQMFSAGGRFTDLRQSCGIYLLKQEDFGLRGCINALSSE